VIAAVINLEFFGRRRSSTCSLQPHEDVDERDFQDFAVLNLSGQSAPAET
jgi:hypothetical protein